MISFNIAFWFSLLCVNLFIFPTLFDYLSSTTNISAGKNIKRPIFHFHSKYSSPKAITVTNFNIQSDFTLLNIYPYKDISRDVFNDWVKTQNQISFDNILANVGDLNWSPDLVTEKKVSLGAVIASPSTNQPNYFFQWIRDSAITVNSIVNYLSDVESFKNSSLQITVENYLLNSYHLQRTSNPSGEFNQDDLTSLGEPKFMVDSTPFLENWGRPQNDGPPLRIITIENFMKNLLKFNSTLIQLENFSSLNEVYDNVVKFDLKFIIKHWNDKTFDLWEEINSYHFFTSLTQLKALKIGLKLYHQYDNNDPQFLQDLERTYNDLFKFINEDSGFLNFNLNHVVETPSILEDRTGLDAAILIGSLLTHDDRDDFIPFDVNDGLILNTLTELIKVMKYVYPINHSKISLNLGVALGRYPEDLYDGTHISDGNPWFLTTLAASELLFKLINNLQEGGNDLVIDSTNNHFYFSNVLEVNNDVFKLNDEVLNIPYNSLAFNQTIDNLFHLGDSFLDIVREHVANDGSMSEQFNRYNGFMQGAENLTWSYGAFWSAYRWRSRALLIR